jgi:enoyl-CoA hydratase
VNRVVAREQHEEETLALANKIAEAPPFTLKLIKRSLNRTQDIQGLHAALNAHFDLHELSHATEAQKQHLERGIQAALQRGRAETS